MAKVPALQVTATAPRFRRAGLEFGKAPTTIALSALTKAQIADLKAENGKGLIVVDAEVDGPEPAADEATTKPEAKGTKAKA